MTGKGVAIVTGGSRGIGRATALKLGAQGYTVVVNYASNEAAANEVVNAITAEQIEPALGPDVERSGVGEQHSRERSIAPRR